jgi:hypothetical protein
MKRSLPKRQQKPTARATAKNAFWSALHWQFEVAGAHLQFAPRFHAVFELLQCES